MSFLGILAGGLDLFAGLIILDAVGNMFCKQCGTHVTKSTAETHFASHKKAIVKKSVPQKKKQSWLEYNPYPWLKV